MSEHITEERLDDYHDRLVSAEDARAIEAHLGQCEPCRSELARLERLSALAAGLPREIEPPPEVWQAIRQRTIERKPRRSELLWSMRWGLAAASIVLMLVSSAVTLVIMRSDPAVPVANSLPDAASPSVSLAALELAEPEYAEAVTALAKALELQRDRLDPATAKILEDNLAIIDRAILAGRAALQRDPANVDLAGLVSSEYQRKIKIMERALRLSTDL